MSFRTFTRTWWRENREWPNGLEPCPGKKYYHPKFQSEEKARAYCQEWNATHEPGRLSRKCEYEEV